LSGSNAQRHEKVSLNKRESMDIEQIERMLRGRSYQEIERDLSGMDSHALLRLCDSRLQRVGNTAADLLSMRRDTDLLINAILGNQLSTSVGKTRALSILQRFGMDCPRALDAYLHLLSETHFGVVDWALFGIVFMQDERAIPYVRRRMSDAPKESKIAERLACALEALVKKNPYLYSPYFSDAANVWRTKG
jgi:hypothetical protein